LLKKSFYIIAFLVFFDIIIINYYLITITKEYRMALFKDDGTPYRVLIIDDSLFITKQLAHILASEGLEVVGVASDGGEGLDCYKEKHPNIDLVTLDITMPRMDGIEALEKILAFHKEAKVIMITALGKEDVVRQALLMGAKGFIVKPIDRKKVLDRVTAVLTT
jgi:two-component system chemotaxis response regulator CheY